MPEDSHVVDYARRVADILAALERVEDCSQLALLEDLRHTGFDCIRLRTCWEEPGADNLLHSLDLLTCGRDLLLAAACAAAPGQTGSADSRAAEAEALLQEVRVARGSVDSGPNSGQLQLLAPVDPVLAKIEQVESDPAESGPAGRDGAHAALKDLSWRNNVVPTLQRGLTALQEAAHTAGPDRESAPALGLAARLCDAIAPLFERPGPQTVEIRIVWSVTRRQTRPSATFRMDRESVAKLRAASGTRTSKDA